MKYLTNTILFLAFFLAAHIGSAQISESTNSPQIQRQDIENILGNWEGALTYLDYSSNKPYSMPCNISVSEKKKNRKLIMQFEFPNEPKANNKEKFKISKSGDSINGNKIVSRKILQDNKVELITEYSGNDGNEGKAAIIRNIYNVSDKTLSFRKEVKFVGTEKWILRNEFNFKKANS